MPGQCHCLGPAGTIRIEKATQNWAPAQPVESQAWGWWMEKKEPISPRLAARPIITCLGTCWPMTMPEQVTPHLQVKPIGPAKGVGMGHFSPPSTPLGPLETSFCWCFLICGPQSWFEGALC